MERHFVDVEFPVSFSCIDQELTVRRPSVQVRRTSRRDSPGCATFDGKDIDDRLVAILLTVIADADRFAVERQYVIVVVVNVNPSFYHDRRVPSQTKTI